MYQLVFGIILFARIAVGQPQPILLAQARDNEPARNLTGGEFAALGDPFFLLVLKDHVDAVTLADIERFLQPDATKRQLFVVSERLRELRPGDRRAVLTYTGKSGEHVLDTNVMLSVFFGPNAIHERAIEAWGWDNQRSRYNYYRLDDTGTPTMTKTWKFRGSSDDADLLTPADRGGTCMACHLSGAPIMKELLLPWNNWHSFSGEASYLKPGTMQAWPIATADRFNMLRGAEELERPIISAIRQFNRRRINQALARTDQEGNISSFEGRQRVLAGKRLLRSLFQTTEFNIISAGQGSGMHPLPAATTSGPGRPVTIPASFFLNANLLAGNGLLGYEGLGVASAGDFGTLCSVRPDEYKQLVQSSGLQLLRSQPADAHFAWFVPEPSHVDNDLVDQLLRRGIISRAFAAAVLAVDLEHPLLSMERARLLPFVPNAWDFMPAEGELVSTHPDALTIQVIEALRQAAPQQDTAEGVFLKNLEDLDPVKLLTDKVSRYAERVRQRLNDPATRTQELQRLQVPSCGVPILLANSTLRGSR